MSPPKVFPDSIVNCSTEKIIADYRKSASVIYRIVLLSVLLAIAATFFVSVQIGVRASGIIKPQGERNLLTSPITGRLTSVRLLENLFVNKGDTLFIIDSQTITSQLPALEKRKYELNEMINDLNILVETKQMNKQSLKSPLYIKSYNSYKVQLENYRYKEQVTNNNYVRYKQLYDNDVIPLSEFEPIQTEKDNAILSREAFENSNRAQWQSDLSGFENELRNILTQINQINIQSNETIVLAPMSGSIQSIEKVTNGMFVHAGQQIAEISPDGQFVAECAVLSRDIGFIRIGQKVRLQVDAFDYNIWGILDGKVIEIFDDIVIPGTGQIPYYRIYCSLDSDHLTLKNGHTDYVKKGMSVNAHFIAAKRTVFQLIYDKIDQWLNPLLNDE
jgi:HlyD family secretion protein